MNTQGLGSPRREGAPLARRPLIDGHVPFVVTGCGAALLGIIADPAEGWSGVLTAGLYGLALTLGAALFVAIHGVTGATWWYPLRRIPAGLIRTFAVPALVLLVVFGFGLSSVYPWTRPGAVEHSHVLHEKAAWLDATLFLARAGALLVAWALLLRALRQRLGDSAEPPAPPALRRTGALFLVAYAVTASVATWDWVLGLEPEWYDTMSAVYVFAGSFVGGIAAITLVLLLSARATNTLDRLPPKLLHDLGKLLFAFSFFWGYIWYCQFMLVWYANLPEETSHFVRRLHGGWSSLFWLNIVLNFGAPFLVLLPARTKKHAPTLLRVVVVVLVGRWLDTWLLAAPGAGPAPTFPFAAVGATVAVVAAMSFWFRRGGGVLLYPDAAPPRLRVLAEPPDPPRRPA